MRINARSLRSTAGCYGRDTKPDKGDYLKLCGEAFWTHVSGDATLYVDLIEPLGKQAKERNEDFKREYAKVRNRFTKQFLDEFCSPDGEIDWTCIVKLGSANTKPAKSK